MGRTYSGSQSQDGSFNPLAVEDRLRKAVSKAGIPLFGIASPDQPAHFDHFLKWLETGGQAGMAYLSRPDTVEKRRNPKSLMENTRSILVFGFPYPLNYVEPPPGSGGWGQIAAYAGSRDYHTVLPERLGSLIPRFEEIIGQEIRYQIFTDSAPILERDLARSAGLGWVGRNGCLISPKYGSGFLLAEMFCDVLLQTSQPFLPDRCGTCRRCVDACPTGCINPDRTLDANRCLSYLTIENKGPIPSALRDAAANHLFGCDVCQQVCPWNHTPHPRMIVPEIQSDRLHEWVNLLEVDQLSPDRFREQFEAYPVMRAKWKGFLRNAAVVLGNSGNQQTIPVLQALLDENPEAIVRAHAAWAIGKLARLSGSEPAREILTRRLSIETDITVREEIQQALHQG